MGRMALWSLVAVFVGFMAVAISACSVTGVLVLP